MSIVLPPHILEYSDLKRRIRRSFGLSITLDAGKNMKGSTIKERFARMTMIT